MTKKIENIIRSIVFKENIEQPISDTMSWDEYGNAVRELVHRYSQHNASDVSVRSAPNTSTFVANRSGKIEYAPYQDIHHSYSGLTHRVHHAVKVGTNYPPEKAAAFEKDLKEIPMPTKVMISGKAHKVSPIYEPGSNFATRGLFVNRTPIEG